MCRHLQDTSLSTYSYLLDILFDFLQLVLKITKLTEFDRINSDENGSKSIR